MNNLLASKIAICKLFLDAVCATFMYLVNLLASKIVICKLFFDAYSKVLNNSAARLLIFKIFLFFPTNTVLFGPTRLLKFR